MNALFSTTMLINAEVTLKGYEFQIIQHFLSLWEGVKFLRKPPPSPTVLVEEGRKRGTRAEMAEKATAAEEREGGRACMRFRWRRPGGGGDGGVHSLTQPT